MQLCSVPGLEVAVSRETGGLSLLPAPSWLAECPGPVPTGRGGRVAQGWQRWLRSHISAPFPSTGRALNQQGEGSGAAGGGSRMQVSSLHNKQPLLRTVVLRQSIMTGHAES